ncbi:N-acetyl-D-Glu racemase DgcA [Chelativorans sp. M5D2P16]|uniref:N-acetyl-D-Glu racemase DgcA n=1 Tax=Chelativorans sp. M5D2P16 TaxID=3095678 RepID=UPI002ACA4D8C|nr:N-acetyl-D-Glu racemase DgcA [Chelativorans sp. M5D2P16]MDZ5697614.1 N-acetyl-D-Glu racemase DgcA [Chelativorans sp. M5D2P16]
MTRTLTVKIESFPIAGVFRIARGAKTEATVVTCMIGEAGAIGRGECVPYARYGESMESVVAQIETMRGEIAEGIDRQALMERMPAGAARNAVDCALWDLEAKRTSRRVEDLVCAAPPAPLVTAQTVSLGTPEEMAAQARDSAGPLLKIKVGAENDAARLAAVAAAAPDSRLIVDANEGWNETNLEENLRAAAQIDVALIEQPLPAGKDAILGEIPHPVPICADESLHTADDLPRIKDLYDAVNIKLDKTGGLTGAILLRDRARELGLSVMVGCMVGTSLAMAPAVLLAQGADFVDLDGPLLLKRDRIPGLVYADSRVFPPEPEMWG